MSRRVTLTQAIEETGLTEYTLRQGIKEGRYPHIRTGTGKGKILIDIDLLEQYLRQEAIDNANHPVANPCVVIDYGKLRRVEGYSI